MIVMSFINVFIMVNLLCVYRFSLVSLFLSCMSLHVFVFSYISYAFAQHCLSKNEEKVPTTYKNPRS